MSLWIYDHLGWVVVVLLCVVGVVVVAMVVAEQRWQRYAQTHCRVMGEVSGSVGTTIVVTPNVPVGVGTTYIPGKTGYACDDGKEYWR